jgi:hypothetical protein
MRHNKHAFSYLATFWSSVSLLFYFRFQADKVSIMAFSSPEVVSEHTPVLSQPYDKAEFYIGLCLAVSSSVFIGKLAF